MNQRFQLLRGSDIHFGRESGAERPIFADSIEMISVGYVDADECTLCTLAKRLDGYGS
jgi:hypothetical protein